MPYFIKVNAHSFKIKITAKDFVFQKMIKTFFRKKYISNV